MISLAGSTHLAFTFPAALPQALEYYGDLPRTLSCLPHISVQRAYGQGCYRLVYQTIELGVYRVCLVCDIRVEVLDEPALLRITPWEAIEPVPTSVSVYAFTVQAQYRSESQFIAQGQQTHVDYRLTLNAQLPIPFAARLIPHRALDSIAQGITHRRIQEIARGFIETTIEDYQAV
jgi:hypothetical protein